MRHIRLKNHFMSKKKKKKKKKKNNMKLLEDFEKLKEKYDNELILKMFPDMKKFML